MMCCEKPMGLLQCSGPLFWLLTHHTCCLLYGWAICLKWSLIGIVICGGIGGKFWKLISCGVQNHQRLMLIIYN
jgi:hypothetical protein